MQAAGSIIGGGMQIGGAILGASAADKRRREIEKIANMPGVDLNTVYSDTTQAGIGAVGGANELATKLNRSSSTDLQNILGTAIPGYAGLQATRAGQVGTMLKGELPSDVTDAVSRRAAAHSVAGGYGGSGMARNLEGRDLGLTSLDIIGKGMTGMESILRSTPLPRIAQANDYVNITGQNTANLRSKERTEKFNALMDWAASPTSQDVWAKTLTDMGGSMAGGGGGGGGGGMGGGILGMAGGLLGSL